MRHLNQHGPGMERLPGPMGWLVTASSRRSSSCEHSKLHAPVQGPWKFPGFATNSAGALPGWGHVVFRDSPRRRGCRAPWRPLMVAPAERGTARSPAPASPARSRHGKLLRANVAGTMESPGLPSAEILGCVSYAHRHGSSESLVYTRPRHITVFFSADTIFWSRGRRKKFEGVAVRP